MLIFNENEICLLLTENSIEEVEVVSTLHAREIEFDNGPELAFVYMVKLCLMPDILLYVRPSILKKLPDKDIQVKWENCIWKPEKK